VILCPTHRTLTTELVGAKVVRHRCPVDGCGYMRLVPATDSEAVAATVTARRTSAALRANLKRRERKRVGVLAYREGGLS
jgi:hypothetical protein